ncbi:MAG: cytochrome-c peroxidase [Bacteroidia bacterium]|nr:cytochrome-c peroxidase [Bacteroidia bacterium]
MRVVFIPIILVFFFLSCKVDPKVKPHFDENELKEIIPTGWPEPVYRFQNNPINKATFELGRALFYDPILSVDSTVSCESCHQQFVAFAHSDHALSHGVANQLTTRNSPALFNLNWHPLFMHDGGVNHIEVQPLAPINNPIEMGENTVHVIKKLRRSARYKKMFEDAFGKGAEINDAQMLKALAQFMALMYSYNSKYDRVKRGEAEFHQDELEGYQIFQQKCNQCHKEPLFSDFQFRNNGLSVNPAINDSGRAHITGLPSDRYKFKTPSLRNITLTAPYMHDGRFNTLDQCLQHYVSGITNTVNLAPELQGGIPLTPSEIQKLKAFLATLTDYTLLTDKKFSNPYAN